jgi:DNA-binding winged helix-turn-helix (wHTH) protein
MRVRFGAFIFDPEARELRRGDSPVPLSPKAFDLLGLLVAHRPKAMAKSDLQDRLWPGTFVVEKNLANLVGEIRDALGDDASDPQFIRTVHRFGYAFRDTSTREEARPASGRGRVVFALKWEGGRVMLNEGEYVLGRDPDVEIFVNSNGASRRHALIRISSGRATIEDLGSKNGTVVGNQRVTGTTTLAGGDIIRIGSVKLTVKAISAPRTTETEPGIER